MSWEEMWISMKNCFIASFTWWEKKVWGIGNGEVIPCMRMVDLWFGLCREGKRNWACLLRRELYLKLVGRCHDMFKVWSGYEFFFWCSERNCFPLLLCKFCLITDNAYFARKLVILVTFPSNQPEPLLVSVILMYLWGRNGFGNKF